MARLIDITPQNIKFQSGYSFTRSTDAWEFTKDGIFVKRAPGVLRNAHYINGNRTFLTEPASTNDWEYSHFQSGYTAAGEGSNPPTVGENTSDFVYGTQSLEATWAGSSASFSEMRVRLADSEWTNMPDGSTATWTLYMKGPVGESVSVLPTGDTSLGGELHNFSGDWERVTVTRTNSTGGAKTVRLFLYLPSSAYTMQVDACQLEKESAFPTSYIPTSGSAVTRNADELSVDWPHDPQEMTVYAKYVKVDTGDITSARTWGISNSGNDPRFVQVGDQSTAPRLVHDDGSSVDNVNTFVAPFAPGDVVETAAQLSAAGTPTLIVSKNGGAEVSATDATPNASLQPSWGLSTLFIGYNGGVGNSANAFQRLVAVTGVQSMDAMRKEFPTDSTLRIEVPNP